VDTTARARADLLRNVGLFAPLDRLALAQLAAHLEPVEMRSGQELFRKGDRGDALYVVASGMLGVYGDENERLSILVAGDTFGEMALLCEDPRSATVRAESASELVRLDRERFQELLEREPKLGIVIARELAERLRERERTPRGAGAVQEERAADRLAARMAQAQREAAVPRRDRRTRAGQGRSGALALVVTGGAVAGAAFAAVSGATIPAFLLLFAAAVTLWVTEIVPEFAVALGLAAAWILAGIATPARALGGFASAEWIFVLSIAGIAGAIARSGLLFRVGLLLIRRTPPGLLWQAATLLFTGVLLTPLLPRNQGRVALTGPLAVALASAGRLRDREPAAAVLGLAAWIGASPLMFLFQNGSNLCLLTWGLLPETSRRHFTWAQWLIAAAPLGLFLAVASLALLVVMLRPRLAATPAPDRTALQLAVLGPPSRRELTLTVVLVLTVAGWILAPTFGIDVATVAVLGFLATVVTGLFDKRALRDLDWGYLVFYAIALSISQLTVALGLDRALADVITRELQRLGTGPLAFVLGVALVSILVQLVLPKNQATLLLALALIPVASSLGVDPWVAVITILATSSMWILPTQTSSYLVAYSATEGRLYSHAQAQRIALGYVALTFAGLAFAVPFWHALGLL
jgi:CRP-like cAMP-binding protein